MYVSVYDCQLECAKKSYCLIFQYQRSTKMCQLKTGPGTNVTDNTMITGPATCDYMKSNCKPEIFFEMPW